MQALCCVYISHLDIFYVCNGLVPATFVIKMNVNGIISNND